MLMTALMHLLAFVALMGILAALTVVIYVPFRLHMEGNLSEVVRDYFGPPRPQIRVIGPGGPDDVLFEGEEQGVRSSLRYIPWSERRGLRIEKMEPLPPKIANILR